MILHTLDRHRDKGLLILRVGIGMMFMRHANSPLFQHSVWHSVRTCSCFADLLEERGDYRLGVLKRAQDQARSGHGRQALDRVNEAAEGVHA